MKIFTEETGGDKLPGTFVLILDKQEARTLYEIVPAAEQANKRRTSFRLWRTKLEKQLCAW